MQIKQLQLAYAPEEDRMLMRINSSDGLEVRCWLTRRMISLLVPGLDKMMQKLLASDRPLTEVGRKALLEMSREVSLYSADFNTPFQDQGNATPLGADPLLITQIELRPAGEGNNTDLMLQLKASDGTGFEMRMAEQLQHGFADLMIKTCHQADWGLEFKATPTIIERPESRHLN